ncbi:DUF4249 family protein [candidate division KSB1 bacterium]|nr:DUF4249 family protein [candidate division KSB1 bacterium]
MKYISMLVFAAFLIISGCTKDTTLEPESDQIVVRGYIYAGEPVSEIQITETLPLGSEATTAPPVNNATVSLTKAGSSYALVPSAGDNGYYHYQGDDLTVASGDEFEIQVEANGTSASAKTIVPYPPDDLTISASKLIIPETFEPGRMFDDSTRFIELEWKEDAFSLFYIVVECTETNPEEITGFGGPPNGEFSRRMVFPPTNHNHYRIAQFDISYYGNHVAKVYRVNQEYADLYESRNQDSRDLNEPLTNIENGLGIFSAFASQSVSFEVVAE